MAWPKLRNSRSPALISGASSRGGAALGGARRDPVSLWRERPTVQEAPRSHKVTGHAFISYVRDDAREGEELQRTLEAAGIPVWRDATNLWPGQDWRVTIRKAITAHSLVFVACFSNRSLRRSQSYQNEELVLAIEQIRLRRPETPWLIPVRFDDCTIPDYEIGGGRLLSSIQRADLFGERAVEESRRLVAGILQILDRQVNSPSD